MKINAIELRDEHEKFQIKARIMLTGVNAGVLSYTWGTNEGDVVDIVGWIKYSHADQSMGRAVRTVAITVEYVNGVRNDDFEWNFHTIVCNMGSHITVEITDPMDVECENESTMGEELEAMFGQPDPESDGPMCELVDDCVATATHVGLDTDGETKILLCEAHSHSSRPWGVWPIEDDDDFGVPVGAEGKYIYGHESDRATGVISEEEYRVTVAGTMAHEVGLIKARAAEVCRAQVTDAVRQYRGRLITESYMNTMIDEAMDRRDGVSLAKV